MSLLRDWTVSATAGEFVGFLVPAVVGAVLFDSAAALPALMVAGVVEGSVLGWSQARVLRHRLPAMSVRRWVLGTGVAAACAYLLGMSPSTFYETWSAWPVAIPIALGVLFGVALLGSIGVAQWLELRRHLPRAGRWIVWTAGAWLAGLTLFLVVCMPLWQPGQPLWLTVAIGALGGLLMAFVTALVTGFGIRHLLGTEHPAAPVVRA
ncbi:hypothetical protein [Rhodococcus aetherivorans]|uniref:hypothetical protein n=1 Tax=Rhodococcus aetherivorans TaxID=191292 RepID=UPI00045CCFAE|nr:hypothetical protein [Rhodococcus aetherivorans]KDE14369.1 hypothetical protein N505_0105995 [Rhodococcus aetherivorans]